MELFHTETDYSTLIFGAFLSDQIAHVGVSLKLFGREIIFEIFQPCNHGTWTLRTDGQTDDRQTIYTVSGKKRP